MLNELKALRAFLLVLWFVLGAGLTGWIVLRNLPPSGVLAASALPGDASPFIGILRPEDRMKLDRTKTPPEYDVLADPVYFQLAVPRFFPRLRVRVEFKNADQPILELGARTSIDQWQFDLKPIEALLLDRAGWSVRQDGEYRIYEKHRTDRGAGEILKDADPRRVAVYHVAALLTDGLPQINADVDLKKTTLDTVVAGYRPPEVLPDGWERATAEFDTVGMAKVDGEVQMVVSAPALKAGGTPPAIRKIEVEYLREAWYGTQH